MEHLILHATTRNHVSAFMAHPAHAVLLTGPHGIGKGSIAQALAGGALHIPLGKLASYPHYALVVPDERGTISIESIRNLARFLQLKTIGTAPLRRTIIIEHADALTTEAQNAYLKLLEEPPADTLLIMTASNVRALLPTIRSRVQTIALKAPAEADLKAFFAGKDQATVNQAYFLSGGLPGLMHALLDGDTSHPLLASVTRAKELLQQPLFERLCAVDSLSKQKTDAHYTVEALLRIAQAGLAAATTRRDTAKIAQWHRIRKLALATDEALARSVNTKLTLTNLLLHL